jgi:hypothetical protein
MMREHKPQKLGAAAVEPDQETQPDGPAGKWRAIVASATKWNVAHGDLVAKFNELTGGECAGTNAGVSVRAVRIWQMDRKLPADGKIGKTTVAAAEREKKSKGTGERADVAFTDAEAGAVDRQPDAAGGDIAEQATSEGETSGEEKVESAESNFEGDQIAVDGVDRIADDMGGGKVAGKLLLVPHVVSLLRKHDFKGALKLVWSSVGQEDRVELVKVVAEKLAGELSERALAAFAKFAVAGLVVDVLEIGWEWTKLGLESIYRAHELGDQKARIRIYAYAWSDTVLRGEHSNPGAVTPEEREAMRAGIEDGFATRAAQPELPFLLLAEYHDEKMAREKLELALMRKAGIE